MLGAIEVASARFAAAARVSAAANGISMRQHMGARGEAIDVLGGHHVELFAGESDHLGFDDAAIGSLDPATRTQGSLRPAASITSPLMRVRRPAIRKAWGVATRPRQSARKSRIFSGFILADGWEKHAGPPKCSCPGGAPRSGASGGVDCQAEATPKPSSTRCQRMPTVASTWLPPASSTQSPRASLKSSMDAMPGVGQLIAQVGAH